MGKNISLFSGYSQRENRTTNYCLLILKLLYEENPKFFGDFLTTITEERFGSAVGIKFFQQKRTGNSIPDGFISQDSFSIFIETKNYDWFKDRQLENHLNSLFMKEKGLKLLIALSKFESDLEKRFAAIIKKCRELRVIFRALSFEEFLDSLEKIDHLPKSFQDVLLDFRTYLDELKLLPTWKRTLDVVNCTDSSEDVLLSQVYVCPAEGGPYNHRRAKFIGIYKNKRVSHVAEILAVVDIESEESASLKWQNVGNPTRAQFESQALQYINRGNLPLRIFLLGEFNRTNFKKDTPSGMQYSKTYFDIEKLNVTSSFELARKLENLVWKDLR